jgi:hypothetical protein
MTKNEGGYACLGHSSFVLRLKEKPPLLCRTRGGSWYHLRLRPLPASPPSPIFAPFGSASQKMGEDRDGGTSVCAVTGIPGSLTILRSPKYPTSAQSQRLCTPKIPARATDFVGQAQGQALQNHRRGFRCLSACLAPNGRSLNGGGRYLSPGCRYALDYTRQETCVKDD